jgi:hypothetical protein
MTVFFNISLQCLIINRVRPIPVSGIVRYRVSGDTHQYRLVSVSGDTFLSIAANTGLASVGHGAISRRDWYRAEKVCGRASHATGSMRTRQISTCSIL